MKAARSILFLLLLAACTSETPRDVAYYLAHPEERIATVSACKNDPGRVALQSNCINATEAQFKAGMRSNVVPAIR